MTHPKAIGLAPLADDPTEVVEQIRHRLASVQDEGEEAIPVDIEDESGDRFGARADGWHVVRVVVQVRPGLLEDGAL